MSIYVIGDLQGCFDSLQALLKKINFDPASDRLGFVGDLINRGPKSLETLRFIMQLNDPIVVLGNHDLYFLSLVYGQSFANIPNTLDTLLSAPDCDKLAQWLLQQPFMHIDQTNNYVVVHAGIPPQWALDSAYQHAKETSKKLQDNPAKFLTHLYGNEPAAWEDKLTGWDRNRYIVNAFTRMRFCTQEGILDLENKSAQSDNPQMRPWFDWRDFAMDILFGHWASLATTGNVCPKSHIYALDTGCLWGGFLTALRIEDQKLFSVMSQEKYR